MQIKLDSSFKETALKTARKRLSKCAQKLVDYIREVKLSKGRRGVGDVLMEGEPPYSRNGRLRQSIFWRWKEGDPNTAQVGTSLRYGLVIEQGRTISATGKLMAVPLSPEAIRHRDSGGSPRTFGKPLTMIPSTKLSGVWFLVQTVRGRNARSIIHWLLVGKVRIRAHPWLVPSVIEFQGEMQRIFTEEAA